MFVSGGLAQLFRQDFAAATQAFRVVAKAKDSPSAGHAQAILGGIRFHEGVFDEAIYWWQTLDASKRAAWQFNEPLQATIWLSAIKALETGRYENAAEKLRQSGPASAGATAAWGRC